MEQIKILKFLKENISPLSDEFYGPRYRASVYLKDGTFLPYVLFSSEKKNIAYDKNLDYSDIEKIEKCKNAFSLDILNQIKGETLMSWTGFVVKMKDGKCFNCRNINGYDLMIESYIKSYEFYKNNCEDK